jgi:hypothetical protein
MIDDQDVTLERCGKGEFRFLAEFSWPWEADVQAALQFSHWKPGSDEADLLFPHGSPIKKKKTQAFYLNGTRTFWIISCAKTWEDVEEFCKRVVGSTALRCDFWECKDPQPLG